MTSITRTTVTITRTATSADTDSAEDTAADTATRPGTDLDTYLATRLQTMHTLPVGDPARTTLRNDIICTCLPIVRRLAARFYGRGETPEDLTQVATIGLIKAVDRFDTTRDTQFLSYATPTIIGEIKRHFRDKGWSIRVSRPLQELYLDINRTTPELAQTLGHTPHTTDLAHHLNVTTTDITRALDAGHAYTTRSLSTPIGTTENTTTLADLIGDTDPNIENAADRTTLNQLLTTIPERERQIITLRFFDNLTQNEIAERIGVSQMHVSRLLTRTLNTLKEHLLAED